MPRSLEATLKELPHRFFNVYEIKLDSKGRFHIPSETYRTMEERNDNKVSDLYLLPMRTNTAVRIFDERGLLLNYGYRKMRPLFKVPIEDLGRVVIPSLIRKNVDFRKKAFLSTSVDGSHLLLTPSHKYKY